MHTERGDDVAIIKRWRQDLHRDDVRDPAMASGRHRLKENLESSTCGRRVSVNTVYESSWIRHIALQSLWFLVNFKRRYAVSSLMDMIYR
ncbi:hypothetical protein Tco_1244992 [Tanacetum coccineum]